MDGISTEIIGRLYDIIVLIYNFQNSPRATSSPSVSANAQNTFYNQQMLLQQQYMQIPSLYGSQQTGGIVSLIIAKLLNFVSLKM